jgi:predicted ATP-grasp superfamily ATP-dependent carboligase
METPIACVMGGLSIIRPLGRAGIPVVAVLDPDVQEPLALSRYVQGTFGIPRPIEDAEGVIAALLRFGERQAQRPVLYFENDEQLLLVSRHRQALSAAFRFTLPETTQVEDLVDKRRFAVLADRFGLPTPNTLVVPHGTATVDPGLRAWKDFPCIIKPALRTHWFGSRFSRHLVADTQKAIRVDSRTELDEMLGDLASNPCEFIVQPFIEGDEQLLVSYHAYARDGVVVADFTGRKIRTTPREYGFSSYVQITDDAEIRGLGRDVVHALRFNGVLKLDFKEDLRARKRLLLEANPRFNLWHHAGAVAGVNLPLLVYRDLIQPGSVPVDAVRARPGVKWLCASLDLSAFGQHRAAGAVSPLGWLWNLATADVVEDLSLRDPLPGAARLWSRTRARAASWFRPRPAVAVVEETP